MAVQFDMILDRQTLKSIQELETPPTPTIFKDKKVENKRRNNLPGVICQIRITTKPRLLIRQAISPLLPNMLSNTFDSSTTRETLRL